MSFMDRLKIMLEEESNGIPRQVIEDSEDIATSTDGDLCYLESDGSNSGG